MAVLLDGGSDQQIQLALRRTCITANKRANEGFFRFCYKIAGHPIRGRRHGSG